MVHLKLLQFLLSLLHISIVRMEVYQKLRPLNDMSFAFDTVKINFQFRYREDLRYSVENEMTARPVDGSVNQVPIRSPHFFGRFSLIERSGKNVKGNVIWEKQYLKQLFFSNMYVLDYEEQFFPESELKITLKGTKILDQRKAVGLQERFYWDRKTQKVEFYIFTNMFPNHVPEAMPFVNDWRTNIELKISFPSSYGYSVITSAKEQSELFIFNRTCLSDIAFVIVNDMEMHWQGLFKFSFKTDHKKSLSPAPMKEFEGKANKIFKQNMKFLSFTYAPERKGLHIVTLPALSVYPVVLGREMCMYDQDFILTHAEHFNYLVLQCILHQYFTATLLPYSPPVRFIADGLFGHYVLRGLGSKFEKDSRTYDLYNDVLDDEANEERAVVLFRDYLEEYPYDKRRINKAIVLMRMISLHFLDESKFDEVIYLLMNSFRTECFTYNDFTKVFNVYKSFEGLQLKTYEKFRAFFNSWTNSTGYPLVGVERRESKLVLKAKLTPNADQRSTLIFPLHLTIIDTAKGSGKTQLVWMTNQQGELLIPLENKASNLYLVNGQRNTPARVMYEKDYWLILLSNEKYLTEPIRATILNDAFYFYDKGELSYSIMFQFLRWMRDQKSIAMWKAMEPVIMEMDRRWVFTQLHSRLVLIVSESIKEFYRDTQQHNNSLGIKFACWARLPECLSFTQEKLIEFAAGPDWSIPMHLDVVLCAGMRQIPTSTFRHFIDLGKRVWMKRDLLLMAMCCVEKEHDVELFIRTIFTRDEFNITTDFKYQLLLNTFMSSATGAQVVWRFIEVKSEVLFSLFGRPRFQELMGFIAQYLKEKSQYRAMQLMFQKFFLPHGNVFETIMANRKDIDRDSVDMYTTLTRILFEEGGHL